MARRTLYVACFLVMLASRPYAVLAEFSGTVQTDAPVVVSITTVNGNESAATILLLASDKTQDVISLSALQGETDRVELPMTRNTRRIVILVDLPSGGNTRVSISEHGAPIFPDTVLSEDTRYTLNVR
jgi:hypothetical protein